MPNHVKKTENNSPGHLFMPNDVSSSTFGRYPMSTSDFFKQHTREKVCFEAEYHRLSVFTHLEPD